jgi:ParB/RepB/Spo0J family partition protein
MQLTLVKDNTTNKTIEQIEIDRLQISPFNPRRTRAKDGVTKLAERISRNGYEITRALWAYPVNGHYEVFAGGTRLEAAKLAGLKSVPVVVHDGFTEEQITRLADEDNENDEYHAPVPIVDKWMDYKKLSELGWTQQRIADAKGIKDRTQVAKRLSYAAFPPAVLSEFVKNDFLKESHATEIDRVCNFHNLSPWLDRETAMAEVVESVIAKTKTPTAKHFADAVTTTNELIAYAQDTLTDFKPVTLHSIVGDTETPYEYRAGDEFLSLLAQKKVRTLQAAKTIEYGIRRHISESLRKYSKFVARKNKEAERAANAAKPIEVQTGEWWRLGNHLLYCGDTSKPEFYSSIPNGAFAFADPPYNADAAEWDNNFAWAHDWLIDKAPIVAVTPGIVSIFDFARVTSMPYVWSMSAWIANGMTRGAMGFGNWIYVALFATDSIYRNAQDFVKVNIETAHNGDTTHKGRKPEQLMVSLVETFTKKNETVIDPFLGSGTTLFVCEQLNRRCIAGEINPDFCKDIIVRWQDMTGGIAEKVA